jgi:signal transduction histidine kinase
MGILDSLKRWEARADAWAQKRLSPEEFREATELDRVLKANWGRLLLAYLGATVTLAALLVGIKRTLAAGEAFVLANVVIAALATGLTGVWFGYRKHAGKPLWRTALATTTLAAAGAVVGALLARLSSGKDLEAIAVEEVVRYVSVGLLAGIVVSAFVVGATWIRTREARAREAAAAAEAERERFAKRTAEAELKLLQAQVEPHFLFNTLANLRYLVQTGSKDALPMLDHLIDYLRTALPEMRTEGSTVGREASLVRAYLEIIRIRMGGELEFRIDAPEDLAEHPLPALMLMSLVENAVKHGIAPVGRGRIEVRVSRAAGRLRVEVDDDGRGVAKEPGHGVGLDNIRERLAVLFGDSAALTLGPGPSGGARATLDIPSGAA